MNWVTVVKIIALPGLIAACAILLPVALALDIAFGDDDFDVMGPA